MKKNNKQAFTLIELLVAVLIVGILAAVALPQYQKAVQKARFAEVSHYVTTAQKAVDLYLLENGFPNEKILFTGGHPNGTLTINLPGKNTSGGGILHYTAVGGWETLCTSSYCAIGLFSQYNQDGSRGNNWLLGEGFVIRKGPNISWTLFSAPINLKARKLICEWWQGPMSDGIWFGDNQAKTKCAKIGITR